MISIVLDPPFGAGPAVFPADSLPACPAFVPPGAAVAPPAAGAKGPNPPGGTASGLVVIEVGACAPAAVAARYDCTALGSPVLDPIPADPLPSTGTLGDPAYRPG